MITNKKIIYFTKYTEKGPSSRYRSFQYFDQIRKHYEIIVYPLFNDKYIVDLYSNRSPSKLEIMTAYLKRIKQVFGVLGTKHVVLIEYELLPYFPPILEYFLHKTNVNFILDFDDAIFHNYDKHQKKVIRFLFKNKILRISQYSKLIITGSPYLTKYFQKLKSNVIEIPTSIIFKKYNNVNRTKTNKDKIIIGWLGSPSTSINILGIKNAINEIIKKYPKVYFKFMGFNRKLKDYIGSDNISFVQWSPKEELIFLKLIDFGIMPLENNDFNQGKCGFKLIQYMASGKATISSPFEANIKINRSNNNLFAENEAQWIEKIEYFLTYPDKMKIVGEKNTKIVEKYYCVEANVTKYLEIFRNI